MQPISATGAAGHEPIVNALTVDVEDYFQVSAFEHRVERARWHSYESRVCGNTDRLLEIFDEAGVRATFFVLGWIADRFPDLVRRIHMAGHELASHGWHHELVYRLTPTAFLEDVRKAAAAIEAAAGVPIVGYRAPSYSITRRSLWALDVLIDAGYVYDASIYPIRHDRYGIPEWPRHIHRVDRSRGSIWELPGSTICRGGMNFPIGGGGYFRLLPYTWTKWGIAHVNRVEQRPTVFYVHPWEIDPKQPRMGIRGLSWIRHYANLKKTEGRLRQLVRQFRFDTVSAALHCITHSRAAVRSDPFSTAFLNKVSIEGDFWRDVGGHSGPSGR